MKGVRLVIVLLFATTLGFGQTFNTAGNWNTASNWSTGSVPSGTGTNITLGADPTISSGNSNVIGNISANNNIDVIVQSNATLTLGSSTLFSGGTKKSLTFNNSGTITVNSGSPDGTLEIWGDLSVGNNLTVNVTGNLIIHGNVSMNNGATITVSGGGVVNVGGSLTGGNNTVLTVSGSGSSISVTGAINLSNNSTITTSSGGSVSGGSCSCSNCAAQCGVVPVTLSYFTATPSLNKVELEWETASEINFNYFSLEKSHDGIGYSEISQMKGHGTTKEKNFYSYDDHNPFIGRSYYRLTSNDFDGYKEVFPVVTVDFQGEKAFEVSPNPSNGTSLSVKVNFALDAESVITFYDNLGVTISSYQVLSPEAGITFPTQLKSGVYYAKFSSSGFSKVYRFVVKN